MSSDWGCESEPPTKQTIVIAWGAVSAQRRYALCGVSVANIRLTDDARAEAVALWHYRNAASRHVRYS